MPTIEKLEVTTIRIVGSPALDPINVIFQDFGPGKGKIIIECFSQAWAACWGGMGNRTMREFFTSCDDSYLFGYLWPQPWAQTRNTVQQEKYLMRIIAAVKAGIVAERQAAAEAPQRPSSIDGTISYTWQREGEHSHVQIRSLHAEILADHAEARIAEQVAQGMREGELLMEIEGTHYRGWWKRAIAVHPGNPA